MSHEVGHTVIFSLLLIYLLSVYRFTSVLNCFSVLREFVVVIAAGT